MKKIMPGSSRVVHFPWQKVINELNSRINIKKWLFFVITFKSRSSLIYSEVRK